MAFVALPGGVRIAMEFTVQGKVVVNIYHVSTTDPIVSIKLLALANIFVDWWATDMKGNFSQDIGLFSVVAHDVSVPNGIQETVAVSPTVVGGIAEGAVTNNVALVASFRTLLTGRSFQGRSYQAGINVSDIDSNKVSAAKATDIALDYTTLMGVLDAADAPLVIASYITNGVPRVTALATPVSAVLVKLRVDTQRRRLPDE